MYTDIERRRSSASSTIQRWISPLASKMQCRIASLAKKPKKAMVLDLSANWIHDTILAVAVLTGAVAFGFWWDSLSAGLFAGFALFFLAGIHRACGTSLRTFDGSLTTWRLPTRMGILLVLPSEAKGISR